jgi:SAM-dependent methyltransferase
VGFLWIGNAYVCPLNLRISRNQVFKIGNSLRLCCALDLPIPINLKINEKDLTDMNTSWWSNFFTGMGAEVVSRLNHPNQTRQEADFIQKVLQLTPGATIGDVPCGDGRLLVEFAKRGFRARGIDISSDLIASAKRSASSQETSILADSGDMKQLTWVEELDGAFCFGNSFAYFDEEGNRQFLGAIYRALKSGGRFLLQTNVIAESIFTKPLSRTWYELGDILFLHVARYEPETSRLVSDYQFIRGQEIERKSAEYRIYTVRAALDLLQEVGFRSPRTMGSLDETPFKLGDPSLYIIVQK